MLSTTSSSLNHYFGGDTNHKFFQDMERFFKKEDMIKMYQHLLKIIDSNEFTVMSEVKNNFSNFTDDSFFHKRMREIGVQLENEVSQENKKKIVEKWICKIKSKKNKKGFVSKHINSRIEGFKTGGGYYFKYLQAKANYKAVQGGADAKNDWMKKTKCRKGKDCTNWFCGFKHSEEWNKKSSSGRKMLISEIQCRNGINCENWSCGFKHPEVWKKKHSSGRKMSRSKIQCRNGIDCVKSSCGFKHSDKFMTCPDGFACEKNNCMKEHIFRS